MSWDKNKPAGAQKIRLSDEEIRENWDCLDDALARDHNFPGTKSSDAGEHEMVTLREQSSWGSPGANKGFLGTKEADGKAELHFKDEDDNLVQFTSVGMIGGNTQGLFSAITATTGILTDTIAEDSAANGVTIDGLNIKDGKLNTNDSVVTANVTAGAIGLAELAADAQFAGGTVMIFGQAAAPTGWTKKTDWTDNSMLVYTTGTPGSGGSDAPQSWATALSVQNESGHTHNHGHQWHNHRSGQYDQSYNSGGSAVNLSEADDNGTGIQMSNVGYSNLDTDYYTDKDATGGSVHTHTLNQDTFTPIYQEVIAATKD